MKRPDLTRAPPASLVGKKRLRLLAPSDALDVRVLKSHFVDSYFDAFAGYHQASQGYGHALHVLEPWQNKYSLHVFEERDGELYWLAQEENIFGADRVGRAARAFSSFKEDPEFSELAWSNASWYLSKNKKSRWARFRIRSKQVSRMHRIPGLLKEARKLLVEKGDFRPSINERYFAKFKGVKHLPPGTFDSLSSAYEFRLDRRVSAGYE